MVAVGTGVLLGVGLLALGVAPGVGNGLAAAVGVGVGVAAVRGASAISAPMLGAELLAVAISPPLAPSVLKSKSDAAAPTPPLLAPKLQRGRVGVGSVNPVAVAVENSATSRSPVSPLGTTSEGAVILVELAFPWPLLASTGATVLIP